MAKGKKAQGRRSNNEGSVTYCKERKKWRGQYTYTDPFTGKKRRKSVSDSDTKQEAQRKVREQLAAIDAGTYFSPDKMTLEAWLNKWSTDYLVQIKKTTANGYRSAARIHIIPALGSKQLSQITPNDVQTFINDLHTTPTEKTGEPLSRKTIKNIIGTLSSALDVAEQNGLIRKNPAKGRGIKLPLPDIDDEEAISPLEGEEITAFLQAIKGCSSECLFYVALFTGMRQTELTGLSWNNVDFDRGEITIAQQLAYDKEAHEYYIDTPKHSKRRTIKPPARVMEALRTVKAQQNLWKLRVGSAWDTRFGDLVFTNELGKHKSPSVLAHQFKAIMDRIGAGGHRFHDLRHTYATIAIKGGTDLFTLSRFMGHSDIKTTTKIYGHLIDEMRSTAANIMDAAISEYSRNA